MQDLSLMEEINKNIKKYQLINNNAPLKYYENFYTDSESYILNISKGCSILISIKIDELYRILIRSILGFKEYIYPKELVTSKFLFLKVGLENYFNDTLNINTSKDYGMFNSFINLFGSKLLLTNFKKDDSDTISVNSNYSYSQFSEDIDRIKRKLIRNSNFLHYDYLRANKLFEIKDFNLICGLDNTEKYYDIDVVLNETQINITFFGEKIENEIYSEMRHLLSIKSNQTKIKLKDDDDNKHLNSIMEFVISEINYFETMETWYNEIFEPLNGDKSLNRQLLLKEIFGSYHDIYEFEKSIVCEIVAICSENQDIMKNLLVEIEKTKYGSSLLKGKGERFRNCKSESFIESSGKYRTNSFPNYNLHSIGISLSEIVLNLSDFFLQTNFNIYEDYIVNYPVISENISKKTKKEKFAKFLTHPQLERIIFVPVTRITKYIEMFKNIISYCRNEHVLETGKKCIEHLVNFNHKFDTEADEFYKTKMSFQIQNLVSNCPSSILHPSLKYIDFLDIEKDTLFLFNEILLFTRRKGGNTFINNLGSVRYIYKGFINMESIKIARKMKSEFILYRSDSNDFILSTFIEENEETNMYKLKKTIESECFIKKISTAKTLSRIRSSKENIYLKEQINFYLFHLASKRQKNKQFLIEFVKDDLDLETKTFNDEFEIKIFLKDEICKISFFGTIYVISTEDFYINFYKYLKNALDIYSSIPPFLENMMILFDKDIKNIISTIEIYKNLPFLPKNDIKKLCNSTKKKLLEEKEKIISEKKYKELLTKPEKLKKYKCDISEIICDSDLYNISIHNEQNKVVKLTKSISCAFIDSILCDIKYNKLIKLKLNIDKLKTKDDLKKYVNEKSDFYIILDHFVSVKKEVPQINFEKLFLILFNGVKTDKIITFWQKYSQKYIKN